MSTSPRPMRRTLVVAAALLLGIVGAILPPAWGQEETGNLYGTVVDTEGAALPGVTITVRGIGAPKVQVTDAQGNFRVLALDPGFYQLTAELEGFSTVEYPNVSVRVARNTSLEITVSSAVEEVITVTSESPLLDERKISQGSTITEVELEKIPTARDPWSVLTQTPGVVSDRINVGGSESGQQAVFVGPGVTDDENTFMVDGVEITDMAAIGSSPTYYDFDQFSEMQFSTGGSEINKSAAGVSVNLVTRRGTNEFRGNARFLVTDEDLGLWLKESNPDIESELAPGQTGVSGNQVVRVEDFGFNAGGPVVQDRLWFWGSWGKNDITGLAANGASDDTILENSAFKANAQLSSNNSGQFSWNNGDKQKFGRNSGPSRSQETTWDQRGPTAVIKAEDTHIFSSSFFLTGQWSKVDGGFSLTSKAGGFDPDLPEALQDSDGVWKQGFASGSSSRPQEEWKLDGSYFFNTGNANNEIKFGGRFRDFESVSPFGWPGRNIVHIAGENFGEEPGPVDYFFLYRAGTTGLKIEYTSFWAQDTITLGNLTINAGVRYDLQEGENLPDSVPNFSGCDPATFFGCLPALDFPGNDAGGFEWESISPRVGLTYALGEERKTLLRASLSRFPEQLSSVNITHVNPLLAAYTYFTFTDGNGDNMWTDEATDGEPIFLSSKNVDPTDPTSFESPNVTDPNLDPGITDELLLGVEHALLPEFVVGLNYTLRNTSDVTVTSADDFSPRFIRDAAGNERLWTPADFVPDETLTGTLPNGDPFSVPTFSLNPAFTDTGGRFQTNTDRDIEYQGVNLNFTKRLANRWMVRGYVGWSETEWSIGNGFVANDDPNLIEDGEDVDGGLVATQSGGSGNKGDIWLQASYSANLNGMYQVAPDKPWGFNLATNLFAREGYPLPYFFNDVTPADGITRDILVAPKLDSFRTDDIVTVDFRIDKDFAATEDVSLTLSMDVFNALNENYVLQRERQLNGSRPDFLDETYSPRIWRLGVRLNWR